VVEVGTVESLISVFKEVLEGKRTFVLGVGNELRGDDFIGSYIARKLLEQGFKNAVDGDLSPESFIDIAVKELPDILLIIDAVEAGLKPGTIVFGKLDEIIESEIIVPTTHKPSYSMIKVYVKYRSPRTQCYFLGIQVKDVSFGVKMSSVIENVGNKIVNALLNTLTEV